MIRLKNVSKYYHSNNSVSLGLRGINLEMEKGEFVAITGESGSGKTTLLNVISGMDSYEEGELYFNGHATSHYGTEEWEKYRRNQIAFVYQGYNLIDSYTALQNVESVLLIQGEHGKDIHKRAEGYLEKVGLLEQKNNRATQLSSGQKQRLSIARALAKETELIVADEPTGNLDSENGLQIMKLFHELSQERLVIVVTHNYEQVKDYATRTIRLYGGMVASDSKIENESESVKQSESETPKKKKQKKSIKERSQAFRKRMAIAYRFVSMNRRAQPKRNLLILMLLLFLSGSFFVFYGGFCSNLDGSLAKVYHSEAFPNGNQRRLVIRKSDDSVMTEEDVKKIQKVKYVQQTDLYDGVNDIVYAYRENKDYQLEYSVRVTRMDYPDHMDVKFLVDDQYMRSDSCLKESALSEGRLPEAENEVVLYSKDKDALGSTVCFYFSNKQVWGEEQYIQKDMTVVGILKKKTSQVYFDGAFCRWMAMNSRAIHSILYVQDATAGRGVITQKIDELTTSLNREELKEASGQAMESGSAILLGTENIIFEPNDKLEDGQVVFSTLYYDMHVQIENVDGRATQRKNPFKIRNQVLCMYEGEEGDTSVMLEVLPQESKSSTQVVQVSRNLYNSMYPEQDSKQLTVYIKDYAYTDRVLEAIRGKGYEAISVYQVGATSDDPEKVIERVTMMAFSLGALCVVFVLGVLILYVLMKLKRGDFIILKSLGMEQKVVREINCMDLVSGITITWLIALGIALILNWTGNRYIQDIVKYYRIYHYLLLYLLNVIFALLVGLWYSHHLAKRSKITELKEG